MEDCHTGTSDSIEGEKLMQFWKWGFIVTTTTPSMAIGKIGKCTSLSMACECVTMWIGQKATNEFDLNFPLLFCANFNQNQAFRKSCTSSSDRKQKRRIKKNIRNPIPSLLEMTSFFRFSNWVPSVRTKQPASVHQRNFSIYSLALGMNLQWPSARQRPTRTDSQIVIGSRH